jgi:DNA-binding MarR family transcriptional regulator
MNQLFETYNQIVCETEADYHVAAMRIGLSDSAFNILYTLYIEGSGCNQSRLYKKSGMARSTVNSAIRQMEKKGWLYLVPGEGRNTKVEVTDAGRKVMDRTVARVVAIEKKLFAAYTEEEAQTLIRLNRRFETAFRREIEQLEVKQDETK